MIDSYAPLIPHSSCPLPFYYPHVPAGFPSPADDYIENTLDLNELLIKHPVATFFVRVSGHSMIQAGIHDRDILIVDRSLTPSHGKIVVAAVDGQLTVKRLKKTKDGRLWLTPENTDFSAIEIKPDQEVYIWGVVTHVIHSV